MKLMLKVIALLTGLMVGCAKDTNTSTKSCMPGETQECICLGGKSGVQTCSLDGISWSACAGCENKLEDSSMGDGLSSDFRHDSRIDDTGVNDGNVDNVVFDASGDSNLCRPELPSIIDDQYIVGHWSSLDVDSSGVVHISYLDATDENLKYAFKTLTGWNIEVVDSAGKVGYYTSLGVDSLGKAHVSYYDASNSDLKYATNMTGSWAVETVSSQGAVGGYTSLDVDQNDKVHISYLDSTNAKLMYTHNSNGAWAFETVDTAAFGESRSSLVVEENGTIHVAYYALPGIMKYAKRTGSFWSMETVDDGDIAGNFPALDVDGGGNVHICYYAKQDRSGLGIADLRYSTNAGGSWTTETIDAQGDVGKFSSLTVDSNGVVHVSYYSAGPYYDVKYANNANGSWVPMVLESQGDTGANGTSIRADAFGMLHLSYFDSGNHALKYVKYCL